VGDRYVFEEMQRIGATVGGEQSGHLLFTELSPAGDGILSALALLSVMRETGESLGALATCMRKFPQVLVNVPVRRKPPLESLESLTDRVRAVEAEMAGNGRVLIRYSGTEALARVMVEGAEVGRVEATADELASIIRGLIGEA
jgi:phosphoglucosamine mutase